MNIFDDLLFQDKIVLISGSSKGIGKTLAREMGLLGCRVVLNGTNEQTLAETNQEFRAMGIQSIAVAGDVSKLEDCERMASETLKAFGGIDIVIANAGISATGSLEESCPLVFKKVMDVNYLGTVYLLKACLPALIKSKGRILVTGSASGFRGIPGAAAYSASKMALTALVEALSIELYRTGVTVGLAYVGFTENDAGKKMLDSKGLITKKIKVAKGTVATQRAVALKMIGMIRNRTFKKTFSLLGKVNDAVARFAPFIGELMLKRYYHNVSGNHK